MPTYHPQRHLNYAPPPPTPRALFFSWLPVNLGRDISISCEVYRINGLFYPWNICKFSINVDFSICRPLNVLQTQCSFSSLEIHLIFFKISCDFENFLWTKFVGSQGKYQPGHCISFKWPEKNIFKVVLAFQLMEPAQPKGTLTKSNVSVSNWRSKITHFQDDKKIPLTLFKISETDYHN